MKKLVLFAVGVVLTASVFANSNAALKVSHKLVKQEKTTESAKPAKEKKAHKEHKEHKAKKEKK